MRLRFFVYFLAPLLLSAGEASASRSPEWPIEQPQSEDEALFLRRIADFWQEGEFQIAKGQIEEFLSLYPESPFSNVLCAALGDLYLREKNYSSAMNYYVRVSAPELFDRVFLNRMQCLFHMQWHATLADECETYLDRENLSEEQRINASYFLALSLYQQCLNAAKDPEALAKLAERATPCFHLLLQSSLSSEIGPAYAHLSCLLKDYSNAAQVYLNLASEDPESREEMLFQAALIQSEYDKGLAIQTFSEIASMNQTRAKEAAYNKLVLSFDAGLHDQIVSAKDDLLKGIPEEKEPLARLFLGRSFLALKKYPEATQELEQYVENALSSDTLHAALISLLESSFQSNNLTALNLGIQKLSDHFPDDPELPKAYLSRAQIFKKSQQLEEARAELARLIERFPQFPQKAQASFELTHLEYQTKSWEPCRDAARSFLSQFPHHELALFARRYLISSCAEIAAKQPGNPALKEQLALELESLLKQKELLSPAEQSDWEFLLATTQYELSRHDQASQTLRALLSRGEPFPQEGNALLLLSLCCRDGERDLKSFCEFAEQALAKKANLLDPAQVHTALFNAYLELSHSAPPLIEKAAGHLYSAFESRAEIQTENLLWLADWTYSQIRDEVENGGTPALPLAQRTASILEQFIKSADSKTSFYEGAVCKLAKLYGSLGRPADQIQLLEKTAGRSSDKETLLLLGEAYLRTGQESKAAPLFDSILQDSPTLKSKTSAAAALENARLRFGKALKNKLGASHPEVVKILARLKDLILQRSLSNEPIHLEAALDYVDFQTRLDSSKNPFEKRHQLLVKTRADFERADDILSKDYHEARAKWPRKEKIYQSYMRFLEAEILAAEAELAKAPEAQKELQAKAKGLLLQIVDEQAHPSLAGRARQRLK